MQKLAWAIAPAVFLLFFGVYSFRLGLQPALMHDDFEYTYPSFSLAERGNFGSPLLGPGLNIENRTYNLIVYYYASVRALLIRVFGDGPESVLLANTFHLALLAVARLPPPYSGTVRAYRPTYSDAISALDRTLSPGRTPCP